MDLSARLKASLNWHLPAAEQPEKTSPRSRRVALCFCPLFLPELRLIIPRETSRASHWGEAQPAPIQTLGASVDPLSVLLETIPGQRTIFVPLKKATSNYRACIVYLRIDLLWLLADYPATRTVANYICSNKCFIAAARRPAPGITPQSKAALGSADPQLHYLLSSSQPTSAAFWSPRRTHQDGTMLLQGANHTKLAAVPISSGVGPETPVTHTSIAPTSDVRKKQTNLTMLIITSSFIF